MNVTSKNYIAIGDFVLDVYHSVSAELLGYYPGGSAWNDLMNLSSIDEHNHCYCIASFGNDTAGEFIIQNLKNYNINLDYTFRINKPTKRFHIIVDGKNTKIQKKCPSCGEEMWYSSSKIPQETPFFFTTLEPGIIIIDSLKANVIKASDSFRECGWLVAVDIGYISNMRYLDSERIRSLICRKFDIIQMPKKVHDFLSDRLDCKDDITLFDLLGCRYLSITDGQNGSIFCSKDFLGASNIRKCDAININVVDPTGAGDAYFSKVLSHIDRNGQFDSEIDTVLDEASAYAAERISVVGANGVILPLTRIPLKCQDCGSEYQIQSSRVARVKNQKIALNADVLMDRTFSALDSNASRQLKNVLNKLTGQIVMVGTGGSYVAAQF